MTKKRLGPTHEATPRTKYKRDSIAYLEREYQAGTPMKVILTELIRLEARPLHGDQVAHMARARGLFRPVGFGMRKPRKLTPEQALLKSFERSIKPKHDHQHDRRASVVEKVRYPGGYAMGQNVLARGL